MAENSHRLYFLAVEDVDYIESYGNYVLIHIGEQKYVRRATLKRLASTLRDVGFARIRRSTLINLARVAFAEKLGSGALAFTLMTGTRLVSKARIRLEETHTGNSEDEPRAIGQRMECPGAALDPEVVSKNRLPVGWTSNDLP
jgi:hypothetical protein